MWPRSATASPSAATREPMPDGRPRLGGDATVVRYDHAEISPTEERCGRVVAGYRYRVYVAEHAGDGRHRRASGPDQRSTLMERSKEFHGHGQHLAVTASTKLPFDPSSLPFRQEQVMRVMRRALIRLLPAASTLAAAVSLPAPATPTRPPSPSTTCAPAGTPTSPASRRRRSPHRTSASCSRPPSTGRSTPSRSSSAAPSSRDREQLDLRA